MIPWYGRSTAYLTDHACIPASALSKYRVAVQRSPSAFIAVK